MTRCCEMRSVSVKATNRSESGVSANRNVARERSAGLANMKAIGGTEARSVFHRGSHWLGEGIFSERALRFKDDMRVSVAVDRGSLRPNQSSEPTTTAVTIPAAHEVAPAAVVAH